MIHTILSQWNVVLLSVYTLEPNTSKQNHQLSLKKRTIYHRYLFSNGHSSSFIQKLTKTARPTANKEPTQEFKSTAILPYIKGVSEVLRCCLQQESVRTVFKSETALRSHLVRPKDALEPTKQDGVVYKIPCGCGKVYIGETGKAM